MTARARPIDCIRLFVLVIVSTLIIALARPAWALEEISFQTGVDGDALDIALGNSSLTVVQARNEATSPQDLLGAARADYARLLSTLYAHGRYSGVIHIRIDGREAADISPLLVPIRIGRIDITVDRGPAFQFGQTQITPLASGTSLPPGFVSGGNAFSTIIGSAVDASVEGWRNAGYAKAAIARQSVRADHRSATLDVNVAIAPGPRLRFGRLVVQSDSAVRIARIHKIAGFPTGQQFSPEMLALVATRLRRTGSFQSVSVTEADDIGADHTLDAHLSLVDAKPRRIGLGGEVTTHEGLTLSGYWLHRNLLGGAERFRIEGELSGIGGETGGVDLAFGARYERPATPDPDTSLYVEIKAEHLNEPDYEADQLSFGLGFRRIFSETLEGELGIELRRSRVTEMGMVQEYDLLSLPMSLTWDRRDDRLNPRSGFYLKTELHPYGGFGATSSGARLFADGRVYRAVGETTIVAGRLQLGSVIGPDITDVPPDFLFYSGGGGTVRGQSYQSLGIDLGGGMRRGGKSFVGLSGEVRFGLSERLGLVGFVDAGYIGQGSSFDGSGDWHAGAGIGARFNTAVGPIRVDLALPIGGTNTGLAVYVGIGQAF